MLREAISDEFDASTLLQVDEHLSFRRPGIGPDVLPKLRRGHWAVQRQIDLHGLRTEEAREALGQFVRDAQRAGVRCVRVVHGKGLGSPGKTPVLKAKVHGWLIQKKEVLAFVQAKPLEGGAGALLVRDLALLSPTGGQERGYRAGTENLPAAAGYAAALEWFDGIAGQGVEQPRMRQVLLPARAHGGGGVSDDFPLAYAYASARTLRFADGPDEVHRNAIAKLELARYMDAGAAARVEMPVTRV